MNTFGKATLLAGASAVAMGLATTQASAFEKVDWDWYADIYEKVKIKVKIDPEFDPSGLVQVEKLQIFVGDVKANAWVDYVLHKPAAPGYEIVKVVDETSGTFSGTFQGGFEGHVHDEEIAYLKEDRKCWWGKGDRRCKDILVPDYERDRDDFHGRIGGELGGTFSGDWYGTDIDRIFVYDPLTLDQLPLVEIAATAIGNIESIDSDVAVLVHEGQFVVGGADCGRDGKRDGKRDGAHVDGWDSAKNPNSHTQLAADLLHATLHGRLDEAEIEANAGSYYIEQAEADISATAIANSHSINVDARTADDAVVIADLTQFAYANVTANAYLGIHSLTGYNDLGTMVDADGLRTAVTSVTATAVGNVSNITVCSYGSNCDDD